MPRRKVHSAKKKSTSIPSPVSREVSVIREDTIIRHLPEKDFSNGSSFSRSLKNLPEDLQPAIETAYITGWRIHDEIFTRQKHHVDVKGSGWLRLDPGETKNGEGRNFPFTARLREIIEAQLERTKTLEKATGRIIPWLFHRDGKQIKTFRRSWLTACVKAGLGTEIRTPAGKLIKKIGAKIPHDFRRTAVRNLERAGVSQSDAMKMVGHKTEAIYRRYAISNERSMRESAGNSINFTLLINDKRNWQSNSKAKPIFASDQSFSG